VWQNDSSTWGGRVDSSFNVAELAACGRARWKIENETFNTLKAKGYNFEPHALSLMEQSITAPQDHRLGHHN
jgi:hypothetical protein